MSAQTTKDVISKTTITEESLRNAIAPSTYRVGEIKVDINAAKQREMAAIVARKRMEAVINERSLQRNHQLPTPVPMEAVVNVVEEPLLDNTKVVVVTENAARKMELAAKAERRQKEVIFAAEMRATTVIDPARRVIEIKSSKTPLTSEEKAFVAAQQANAKLMVEEMHNKHNVAMQASRERLTEALTGDPHPFSSHLLALSYIPSPSPLPPDCVIYIMTVARTLSSSFTVYDGLEETTPQVSITKRNYGLSSGYKKGSSSSGNYYLCVDW